MKRVGYCVDGPHVGKAFDLGGLRGGDVLTIRDDGAQYLCTGRVTFVAGIKKGFIAIELLYRDIGEAFEMSELETEVTL